MKLQLCICLELQSYVDRYNCALHDSPLNYVVPETQLNKQMNKQTNK